MLRRDKERISCLLVDLKSSQCPSSNLRVLTRCWKPPKIQRKESSSHKISSCAKVQKSCNQYCYFQSFVSCGSKKEDLNVLLINQATTLRQTYSIQAHRWIEARYMEILRAARYVDFRHNTHALGPCLLKFAATLVALIGIQRQPGPVRVMVDPEGFVRSYLP